MTEEVRNGRREKLVGLGEMIRARRKTWGCLSKYRSRPRSVQVPRAIEAGDDRIRRAKLLQGIPQVIC